MIIIKRSATPNWLLIISTIGWMKLAGFNHRVLSNPNSIKNRLLKGSPFYWVRINKGTA
jgi:hypothetical protein